MWFSYKRRTVLIFTLASFFASSLASPVERASPTISNFRLSVLTYSYITIHLSVTQTREEKRMGGKGPKRSIGPWERSKRPKTALLRRSAGEKSATEEEKKSWMERRDGQIIIGGPTSLFLKVFCGNRGSQEWKGPFDLRIKAQKGHFGDFVTN